MRKERKKGKEGRKCKRKKKKRKASLRSSRSLARTKTDAETYDRLEACRSHHSQNNQNLGSIQKCLFKRKEGGEREGMMLKKKPTRKDKRN